MQHSVSEGGRAFNYGRDLRIGPGGVLGAAARTAYGIEAFCIGMALAAVRLYRTGMFSHG
ncbi:hypothetical protein [Pseudomonas baltica]|uniref:hypothetical protein n=1 Tax=Pseudomonas baltica TaxID=2762576 RepID=UPI00289A0022|nr:hypothetical protein [Pseudomonas baltica]